MRDVTDIHPKAKARVRKLVEAGRVVDAGALIELYTGLTNGAIIVQIMDAICGYQVGAGRPEDGEQVSLGLTNG